MSNKAWHRTLLVLVPLVVLLVVLGVWAFRTFDAVRRVPAWVFGVVAAIVAVGLLVFANWILGRFQASAARSTAPTPAAMWASAHGWEYKLEDSSLDDSMVPLWYDSRDSSSASDVIHGWYDDREAWAFAFEFVGHVEHTVDIPTGQAVVVRLATPWRGRLEASRDRHLVSPLIGTVLPFGQWFIAGFVADRNGLVDDDADTDGLGDLFRRLQVDRILEASRLPPTALLGAKDDDGRYLAAMVDWAATPDSSLPPVLDVLNAVAAKLETGVADTGAWSDR